MITVIGLGTEKGDLTKKGLAALKRAERVFVRNSSPVSEGLKEEGINFETFDALFEKSRSFDTLAKNIAKQVRACKGDVCYCVEGGVSEDRAAHLLIGKGGVQVVEGVSRAAKFAAEAGLFGAYTAVSAYELCEKEPCFPLVIYDLTDADLAGDVKLYLTERCGDEAETLFVRADGKKRIPLYELDRQEDYAGAGVVVYDVPLLEKKRFTFDDCVAILKRLRAPDGCPWDRAQTHESIRINVLEEAYELVDAIDRKDPERMCEETGDVLMQALFHALIEEERGGFTVGDMTSGLCAKLIGRHTHVFGQDKAAGADGALSVWDKNKMSEKHQTTFTQSVNDVPEGFPALLRAQKICKRMAKGGFPETGFAETKARLDQIAGVLEQMHAAGESAAAANALGDCLMVVVQLGRLTGLDCEQALLDSCNKVRRRYEEFEKMVLADGKAVNALTEEERMRYYVEAVRRV